VDDTIVEQVIEAVTTSPHGKIGDGKIFVTQLHAGRAHPHRRGRRRSL